MMIKRNLLTACMSVFSLCALCYGFITMVVSTKPVGARINPVCCGTDIDCPTDGTRCHNTDSTCGSANSSCS
jgi:hypothetical protein